MLGAIVSFTGAHKFLDPRYPVPGGVTITGPDGTRLHGASAEHVYQAARARRPHEARHILDSPTPAEARRRGASVSRRPGWDGERLGVMQDVVAAKFAHPVMREALLSTGDALIVAHVGQHETYWGVCDCPVHKGRGENHLGRLLSAERERIAVEPATPSGGDLPPGTTLHEGIPVMERADLEDYVREHMRIYNPGATVNEKNLDRLTLNTLRHAHTDYDQDQSLENLRRVNALIVKVYPHLAEEAEASERDRRDRTAALGENPTVHAGRTPDQVRAFRRYRADESRRLLSHNSFAVGQIVAYLRGGRARTGVIKWIGHTSIGVEVMGRDGAVVVERVHACDVVGNAPATTPPGTATGYPGQPRRGRSASVSTRSQANRAPAPSVVHYDGGRGPVCRRELGKRDRTSRDERAVTCWECADLLPPEAFGTRRRRESKRCHRKGRGSSRR